MRRIYTIGAGLTACCLAALTTAPSALAADDDVDVVNTETVQVYVGSDGDVQSQRVYEQLTLTGSGPVSVANPIEEQGLRNLDGFSGFSVEDGVQNVDVDVDGVDRLRSVSDYQGDLPLDISIQYHLDGKLVEPSDIVGADGELEVTYTVKNITAQPQEVTYSDGKGGTVTDTVEVPIPIVGSLSTVAPDNFTEVTSDQANMAGDGKGGTKLSFTMTLFPPLGSDETTFGYTATITDGVVPPSSVTALPVNPLESPSFKTAGDSYQSGSETGETLADGATEIDSNLLKLRDGASDLLSGLIQLSDGADELNAGLAGEAAPGAQQLADGAVVLKDGLGQIDDGAGELADGAGRLSDGAERLDSGANRLSDGLTEAGSKAPALLGGLKQVRAGLVKMDRGLADLSTGLAPTVEQSPDYGRLTDGIQLMIDKIGNANQPGVTLAYGLDQLRTQFSAAVPKIQQMADGVFKNDPTVPGAYQQLGCAIAVINLLKDGGSTQGNPCFTDIAALAPALGPDTATGHSIVLERLADELQMGREGLATPDGAANDTTLYGGLQLLLGQLTSQDPSNPGAIPTLTKLECGADNSSLPGVCDPNSPGLLQGLQQVQAGVPALVDGIADAVSGKVGDRSTSPTETFRGGVNALVGGVDQLRAGGNDLLNGLNLLSNGAGDLADGTGQLRAGAGDLSDGANDLAAGTGDASDGSQRLAAGAGDLADGLGDAADGSGRLADGLDEAADGAPQLVDGAERLSDEGMSQLIDAGVDTAQDYGKLYATLAAGAERADTEKMAYGAPEDAAGLTAYTYELLGDDGESGRNTERGLGALVLLGLGGGAFALRRRLA